MRPAQISKFPRGRLILVVLFVLMQVFLLGLKKHETLFLDVYPNDTPGPRVYGPRLVGQTFVVKKNGLARIDLMVGTYGRTIRNDLIFRLSETKAAKALLVEKAVPGSELRDNLYVSVAFKPLRRSRGKEFKFEVGSPDAAPDNAVSLWMNARDIYREGGPLFNDAPAQGEFVFRAYAKRTILAELGRITAKYPGILGSPFALVTIVVFFEVVQVYFLWALLGYFFGRESAPRRPSEGRRKRPGKAGVPNEYRGAGRMADILLVSDDVVGEKMAGPGIRAWEMARSLSCRFRVRLAVPDLLKNGRSESFFRGAPFETAFYTPGDAAAMRSLADDSRIVIFQGYVLSKFPNLKNRGRYLIADIYDPFVLENLFVHQRKVGNLADREAIHLHDLRVFNDTLLSADHFVCASERQKDLYAGSLMSLDRVDPAALDADPSFQSLISVVPFGLAEDDAPPSPPDDVFGREYPQVGPGDILLIWGGVLSNWFDPATLLQGFKAALTKDPRLKLLFLSTGHPNPLLPPFEIAVEARRLAADLGLLDRHVFFRDGWVEYGRRAAFFGRADIGVSIHKTHFETRYAFRTRILDYIKFGLPILCTEGDYFADLVGWEDVGEVVRSENAADIERALLRLAADRERRDAVRARLGEIRARFGWDRVTAPLALHCDKVLAGAVKASQRPGKREISYVCGGVPDSALRRRGRKVLEGRLSLGALARLRRLLRL